MEAWTGWGPGTATLFTGRTTAGCGLHRTMWDTIFHRRHGADVGHACSWASKHTHPAVYVGVLGMAAARRMNQSGSESRRRTAEHGQNTETIRDTSEEEDRVSGEGGEVKGGGGAENQQIEGERREKGREKNRGLEANSA